ncbi:50S ribosomal protein L36 [Staphylococcus hyicus]|nr:50S ribosomal protein L36 [Staphylococcus hyicus]
MILPRVKSYGDISTVTLSPGKVMVICENPKHKQKQG